MMDLEQLDSEVMQQENILIHLPGENHEEMKEEHLDQIQTLYSLGSTQEEQEDIVGEMHEKLEITKLAKPTKKRVSLTIEKKIEIIQRHEKGETQRNLSQEYNVGRTTISDILKRKYKFFKFMSMNADKEENLKRRRTLRRTVHKVLEDQLLEWYNESRAQGFHVSGPMIAAKAQELHKELGYTDNFSASNGWLDRFKVRNGIKLCGLREIRSESDINAVAPFKVELESIAQWYNLSLDQIYNADEADLFWKMLPNPDSDMNEVKSSVRAYRERMTVLCCVNASGSHKLPLVCIGRGKKTRTFTSHEIKTMPVDYFSQETAWMDQDIFKEWFHGFFVPAARGILRSRGLPETALLLIDRSPSHPSDQFLRSDDGFFFCQYFPTKVKSLVQPMEQGIISNMKRHYRLELLNDLVKQGATLASFQKSLSLKDAIRGISLGWESVSEDLIRHCFSKILPSATNTDNIQVDQVVDVSVSNESFEKLIREIPECDDYSYERIEKWLNCDEAEPKKDCNPFKSIRGEAEEHDQSEAIDEGLVLIDIHQEDPQTIEILNDSTIVLDQTPTVIEPETDDEVMEDEQTEPCKQESSQQVHLHTIIDSNVVFEETRDVTCKQALDALNVLIKFMKNDSESRYKDVVMLFDLKRKFKQRVGETSSSVKDESDFL